MPEHDSAISEWRRQDQKVTTNAKRIGVDETLNMAKEAKHSRVFTIRLSFKLTQPGYTTQTARQNLDIAVNSSLYAVVNAYLVEDGD